MTHGHQCLWRGCGRFVSARLWGCKQHWYQLPPEIRDRIFAAYRVGQSIATASDEYRAAIAEADRWVAAVSGVPQQHSRRRCACGDYAIDGKVTCGRVTCGPSTGRPT